MLGFALRGVQGHPPPSAFGSRCSSPLARLQSLFIILVCLASLPTALSQTLINGQVFTQGLAIVDAPNPTSQFQAGSNMPIAVDISGDGKLPQSAAIPGQNSSATRYESLEIYLVSSQTNLNLTVSSGTGFLTQESGSTVKHLNYVIPSCVPAGSYNVTFYEGSFVNNQPFFSITPIPTKINNKSQNGSCTSTNPLQAQPQASSPPPQNPFLPGGQSVTVYTAPSATTGGVTVVPEPYTVTITDPAAPPWPLSSPSAVTVTAGPSTVTKTETTPTQVPITVVMVSLSTLTTTEPGRTTPTTSTESFTATTTVTMNGANAGFVPVNSAPRSIQAAALSMPLLAVITALFLCPQLLW